MDNREIIRKTFEGRLRVRVAALIFEGNETPQSVLLVKHKGLRDSLESFWTPPGGEVRFGESLHEALIREVAEETGLKVRPENLLYTLDFVRPPLHAVSFYFRASIADGNLRTGTDPELASENQLIESVTFVSLADLMNYRVYPEGLTPALQHDAGHAFEQPPAYLGTKR